MYLCNVQYMQSFFGVGGGGVKIRFWISFFFLRQKQEEKGYGSHKRLPFSLSLTTCDIPPSSTEPSPTHQGPSRQRGSPLRTCTPSLFTPFLLPFLVKYCCGYKGRRRTCTGKKIVDTGVTTLNDSLLYL